LMVQENGNREPPVRLRALLARTSWKVSPENSGVWTDRIRPLRLTSPGRAPGASAATSWFAQRMPPSIIEHVFDSVLGGPFESGQKLDDPIDVSAE